jgi:CubicO group peptidase (beta-lactamase class C family)
MDDYLLPVTERALQHRVARAQVDARVPSVLAAVGRDGNCLWSGGHGDVNGTVPTGNTQYRIGSISKVFAAITVMRLRDEGAIRLDDRFGDHVTGTAAGAVTVRQLLSHTAGLATETPPPWWERTHGEIRPNLPDVLWDDPFRHPTGYRWHYSNSGFALLGALVEQVRGRKWFDVVQDEILNPLDMRRTTLMPQAPNASGFAVHPWADVVLPEPTPDTVLMSPAGQLWSTTEDLLRFGSVLLGKADDVLSPDTIEEMCEPASGPAELEVPLFYGLGVMISRGQDRTMFGHLGSMPGFVAALWVDPGERTSVAAFANATLPPAFGSMPGDLLRLVTELQPRLPDPWRPAESADQDSMELTGVWYRGPVPYALRWRGDGGIEFSNLQTPAAPVGLRRVDDRWVVHSAGYYKGEILTVVRDPAGAISHLDLGSVIFTRTPYPPGDVTPGGVSTEWGADK